MSPKAALLRVRYLERMMRPRVPTEHVFPPALCDIGAFRVLAQAFPRKHAYEGHEPRKHLCAASAAAKSKGQGQADFLHER